MEKLPNSMMVMLRGRLRLEEADTSKDDVILSMTPVEIVRECTTWRIGDPYWADCIAKWMVAAKASPENF